MFLVSVVPHDGDDDVVDEVAEREHAAEGAEGRFHVELDVPVRHVYPPSASFGSNENN